MWTRLESERLLVKTMTTTEINFIAEVKQEEVTEFPFADLSHLTDWIDLFGSDGNAFALIAIGRRWLKELEASRQTSDQFVDEAMSSDYESLLGTFDKWFNTELLDEYLNG